MPLNRHHYLFHIQFLGFRYHGWQKQPGQKTVESMLEKTARFIFGHSDFTIIGTSRTDAKVSAYHGAFKLIISEPVPADQLHAMFNENLPPDIKVLKVEEVDSSFNIITAPKIKEYLYLFSSGGKAHPFAAPLLCSFPDELDIERMKQGARFFEGLHNFRQYCSTPGPDTIFEREIVKSDIVENTLFTASFFPEKSFAYHIHGKGFLRHQVRLIFGQLVRLGRGEISLDAITESLEGSDTAPLRFIAPSSGLMLYSIRFE